VRETAGLLHVAEYDDDDAACLLSALLCSAANASRAAHTHTHTNSGGGGDGASADDVD